MAFVHVHGADVKQDTSFNNKHEVDVIQKILCNVLHCEDVKASETVSYTHLRAHETLR